MNMMKRIDKRSKGAPASRSGVCCRTRALHVAPGVRAPPTTWTVMINTVSQ